MGKIQKVIMICFCLILQQGKGFASNSSITQKLYDPNGFLKFEDFENSNAQDVLNKAHSFGGFLGEKKPTYWSVISINNDTNTPSALTLRVDGPSPMVSAVTFASTEDFSRQIKFLQKNLGNHQ